MAVVNLQSILDRIEILNGGETKDVYVSLLEDLTDSFGGSGASDEISTLKAKIEELEGKVKETEETWRNKYIERFKQPSDSKEEKEEEAEVEEEKDYFTEEELEEEWKNG